MNKIWVQLDEYYEYLETKPTLTKSGNLKPESIKGEIEFRNVTFSYPSRPEDEVLKVII